MGLDQFAYKTKIKFTKEVDFESEIKDDRSELVEIHCWRKHANLQGWMESLYREKGGSSEEFNCVPLQLTKEDLDML